ncbi:hypothetical protein HYT84_01420 [Candidatus Micrarchaeota archaeon]|nr:hypothetical protein [Candidatus Micrarchaeota archaeon]
MMLFQLKVQERKVEKGDLGEVLKDFYKRNDIEVKLKVLGYGSLQLELDPIFLDEIGQRLAEATKVINRFYKNNPVKKDGSYMIRVVEPDVIHHEFNKLTIGFRIEDKGVAQIKPRKAD